MSFVRFVLCACGAHGTFRDRDGHEGPDVASKEAAASVLDALLTRGLLTAREAPDMYRKVTASGMREREKDVPRDLGQKVRDWERMRASTNGNLPFESFHRTLDKIRPS